jgi:hypothetical protein
MDTHLVIRMKIHRLCQFKIVFEADKLMHVCLSDLVIYVWEIHWTCIDTHCHGVHIHVNMLSPRQMKCYTYEKK